LFGGFSSGADGSSVGQAFQPAGQGDFPVARFVNTGLESPVNPQAGKPALHQSSVLLRLTEKHENTGAARGFQLILFFFGGAGHGEAV
jgi:hypothetical protein